MTNYREVGENTSLKTKLNKKKGKLKPFNCASSKACAEIGEEITLSELAQPDILETPVDNSRNSDGFSFGIN